LRWSGTGGPEALVFSSLAKAFGVPMAVLGGSGAWIRKFEEKSLTRVHCSPPSIAVLRAAEHALLSTREGTRPRARLARVGAAIPPRRSRVSGSRAAPGFPHAEDPSPAGMMTGNRTAAARERHPHGARARAAHCESTFSSRPVIICAEIDHAFQRSRAGSLPEAPRPTL
jgi:hypothetical protein